MKRAHLRVLWAGTINQRDTQKKVLRGIRGK